jgi:hypothetical protein
LREELRNVIRPEIQVLNDNLTQMITQINEKLDSFLVPDGDLESERVAVVIKHRLRPDDSFSLTGHGAIIAMKSSDDDAAVPAHFYLVSAAHVLIEIAALEESCILIEHKGGPETAFQCKPGSLYLHPDYITLGQRDFGFLELLESDRLSANHWQAVNTLWTTDVVVGRSVVSHGKVFLRGTITSSNETGRFSVLAHSVPGQSGSLVFDNAKSVAGVVHGSSKHKCKHSSGMDDDSSVVFCDTVLFGGLISISTV